MLTKNVYFGLVVLVGVFLTFMAVAPVQVQAEELCCCQTFFGTESCGLTNWPVGQMEAEVCLPGYVWTGGPVDQCPVEVLPDTNQSPALYFQPNVELPGVFEGKQPVDGNLLGRYLRAFYVYFIWIVGILATVMIMFAGIRWITAAGNSSQIESAKSTMNGALIGLVLALSSFVILRTINPALVSIENLSIFKVPTVRIQENTESSEKGTPAAGRVTTTIDLSKKANVTTYDELIQTVAQEQGIDPYFVKAIMMIESSGNPDAFSPAGACGLMQLLPSNTGNVCLRGAANAEANIRAGVSLLKQLFRTTCPSRARTKSGDYVACTPSKTNCTSNEAYVAAAYNGGLGSNCSSSSCPGKTWWECQENPGFAETRDYVPAVLGMKEIVRKWGFASGGDEIAHQIETDCSDGIDNDQNGETDCDDANCADTDACVPASSEICTDGEDNDGDGQVDCADTDCADDPSCLSGPTEEIVCTEDFEGNFPTSTPACAWDIRYNYTGYTWDDDMCRPSSGQGSGWVAGARFNRDGYSACTDSYPNNLVAWMVAGPFDFSDASSAEVVFDWWLRSEARQYDYLYVGYSLTGHGFSSVDSFKQSGDFGDTWHRDEVLEIPSAAGKPQVWVGFEFLTDGTNSPNVRPNGAFIDNIRIKKTVGS